MDLCKLNFTIVEVETFSYLAMKAGEDLSQREIAIALNISPTAVANAVKTLIKKNLITIKKTKTINFISFNRDNPEAIAMKRVQNLKQIYLSGLLDYLKVPLAGATIILFGSYSRGEDAKKSDIDFAVIGRKSKALDLKEFEKTLNRPININFYDSWDDIHKHLKNNILNGIILSGSVEL